MPQPAIDLYRVFPNAATPPGSASYYAIRFAPRDLRPALAVLAAWYAAIQDLLVGISERQVAQVKLDWWRQELERARTSGARHPLSQAIASTPGLAALPAAPFTRIMEAIAAILDQRYPDDIGALLAAAERDGGSYFELIARCHGINEQPRLEAARRLGAYWRLVQELRDCGRSLRRGHTWLLPHDRLAAAGLQGLPHSQTAPGLTEILTQLAAEMRALGAASPRDGLPTSLRIEARLADALLGELERSGLAVLDQSIRLTPIRQLWHAWRESRR